MSVVPATLAESMVSVEPPADTVKSEASTALDASTWDESVIVSVSPSTLADDAVSAAWDSAESVSSPRIANDTNSVAATAIAGRNMQRC